jgi:hypothetical protein
MAAGGNLKGNAGQTGVFRRKMSLGEQKLLELIYALLTTTGCGQCPEHPQPIELWFSGVNRFVCPEC